MIDLMASDEAAVAKLEELVADGKPLGISPLTATEVGTGLRDESAREAFDDVLVDVDVVPFDRDEALRAARIQRRLEADGQRIGVVDAMIAATALERDDAVVTRNVSEFRRVDGVRVTPY
ncbi:type II toxin-antitoxin system VapC family toxin [Halostella sp. JP-L12]|nr:type II toxin-antitoxin system VapC family toxin [Halostella sp. JP-L12]